jgi:hypothetical protein
MLERLPVPRHRATEEELDAAVAAVAAVGDRQRAVGEAALVLDVREEIADLRFGERVGRLSAELGELTDGSHVNVAGALGESGELEVLKETLAKSGHGRLRSEKRYQKGHRCTARLAFARSVQESRGTFTQHESRDMCGPVRTCRAARFLEQAAAADRLRRRLCGKTLSH